MASPETNLPAADPPDSSLRLVLDHLPVALWTTDRDLHLTSAVGARLESLGLDVGHPGRTTVREAFGGLDGESPAEAAHRRALEGVSSDFETANDSSTFRFHVEPMRSDEGEVIGVVGIALDDSERKRSEETLRQVMRGYRAIAELTSEFAYSIRVLDDGGVVLEWVTEGFERLTGFDRHEANAVGMMSLVHPDDAEDAQRVLAAVMLGDTVTTEQRIVTRSGETRWVRTYGMPEADHTGRIARIFGAVQDISVQKATEEDLARTADELRRTDRERLRLLVHLVRAQDEERKRIAEGIHDDSIQMMATLGLRLDALARRLEDPTLRREADVLQGTIDETIARMRTLLFELAPPALRDEGLAVAIEQLLQRIAAEEQDRLGFSIRNELSRELPEGSRLLLFRLAQEALTNVRKHANASNVEVMLDEQDGGVLLEIRDDGVGFSPADPPPPGHMGLAAMRERAEMARGWWRLESEPGTGTTVRVWLPVSDDRGPSRSG